MKELSKRTGNYFKKRNKCRLSYRRRGSSSGQDVSRQSIFENSVIWRKRSGKRTREFISLRLWARWERMKWKWRKTRDRYAALGAPSNTPFELNFPSRMFQRWLMAPCTYILLGNKGKALSTFSTIPGHSLYAPTSKKEILQRERIKELLKRFRCSRTLETRNKSR